MDNQNTFQEQEIEKAELATLRSRISAYIVDVVLFTFPLAIISFIYLLYFLSGKGYTTKGMLDYLFSQINIFGWYSWGALFIYSGILIGKYRWTLGKRYAAIAVVRVDTFKKINYLRAFLREGIKWGLHSIPYISFLILLVNIYLISHTKKKQAIHDMVAGTQVVVISENKKAEKILNLVTIVLFIGVALAFGIFYSATREMKVKPGEEKIISANEYIQKAETELAEVKKYLEEDNTTEIQKHTVKALEYAISATDLEPSNPEIWFRRGNIYWEIKGISQGAEDWAVKCYRKALELNPDNQLYRQRVEELTGELQNIKVSYPNGGEEWQIGDTYGIKWESRGVEKIDIDLYGPIPGQKPFSKRLATGISASLGEYSWTISEDVPSGNSFEIIIGQEGEVYPMDESDNYFSIVK